MTTYRLCECGEGSEVDHSQENISYGELAELGELSHAEQVHRYNWCGCEDGPLMYEDCPAEACLICLAPAKGSFCVDCEGEGE
jgi:hypothetical protein